MVRKLSGIVKNSFCHDAGVSLSLAFQPNRLCECCSMAAPVTSSKREEALTMEGLEGDHPSAGVGAAVDSVASGKPGNSVATCSSGVGGISAGQPGPTTLVLLCQSAVHEQDGTNT